MRQVRRNVFETNSSSTHSLTMCSQDEFEKWIAGELYLNYGAWASNSKFKDKQFVTKEEVIDILTDNKYPPKEDLKTMDNEELEEYIKNNDDIYTYENYWRDDLESFEDKYTTAGGETIIAFGYYGYDG